METRQPDEEAGRAAALRHYVDTGEADILHPEWPGSIIERGQAAHRDMLDALVTEVEHGSAGLSPSVALPEVELRELVHRKIEPMVRGLFPARERQCVQDVLGASVVFFD